MFRPPERSPEPNMDQIVERLRSFAGRFRIGGGGGTILFILLGVIAIALVAWLSTGFYTVQPGEQSALRLLGKFNSIEGPGLHWFPPAPIGTRAVVAVEQIRRLELGFRGGQKIPDEALMITGDENIVDTQLLVQYDIKSIEDFLFRSVDPGGIILKSAAETSLRQVIGKRSIDDVLTTEKDAVQIETKDLLQELMDLYKTGINIREVKLQNVLAPVQVQDAFDDVVRAKEDKQKAINLAQAYEADIVPKARGEAARLTEGAEAFKAERINAATGQASRFLSVLQEYRKSREVTKRRLYLEAMEQILPGVTKIIGDSDKIILVAPRSEGEVLPVPVPPVAGSP